MHREPEILIFNIGGKVCIGREKRTRNRYINTDRPYKRHSKAQTHSRRERMINKTAANDPRNDDTLHLVKLNRGVQTHLIYFTGIARYAADNGQRIAYGEYRKRVKEDQLEAEQRKLMTWIKRNLPHMITAVSIGYGNKGYITIYFIMTSEEEIAVHDAVLSFVSYLRRKGHYRPIELEAYNKDPEGFIKAKYSDIEPNSLEELLCGDLWKECWEVMRTSFKLPYRHKTIRTQKAEDAIKAQTETVNRLEEVYISPQHKQQYFNTFSTFLIEGEADDSPTEWDTQEPEIEDDSPF